MTDVLTLLSEANPVRAADLSAISPIELNSMLSRRRRPPRPLVLVVAAIAAAALTGFLLGVFAFSPTSVHQPNTRQHPSAPVPMPPRRIPLAGASSALGAPVVLPNTSLLGPSGVGSVTEECAPSSGESGCVVNVEFPSQGLVIRYGRYGPPFTDPLPGWEGDVTDDTVPREIVYLGNVPAFMTPKGPESPGSGSTIAFQLGETTISIFSRDLDGPAVEDLAQSIVDRSGPTELPHGHAPLEEAAALFGAPIVLPSTPLVASSDASPTVSTECPTPREPMCELTIDFPSQALTVRYLRGGADLYSPAASRKTYEAFVSHSHLGASIVDLNGTTGLFVPQRPEAPGWIQFTVGQENVNVFVQGRYDEATLRAVAQSIVDRSRAQK